MNENLNLVEILKDVPEGTELYSLVHGKVKLSKVCESEPLCPKPLYPICVTAKNYNTKKEFACFYTSNGVFYCEFPDSECVLFPSKDQRDWSKFIPPLKDCAPVMVSENGINFLFRYYSAIEKNSAYDSGYKDGDTFTWPIIIPFDKFDPNNIEESLKYNIVK